MRKLDLRALANVLRAGENSAAWANVTISATLGNPIISLLLLCGACIPGGTETGDGLVGMLTCQRDVFGSCSPVKMHSP